MEGFGVVVVVVLVSGSVEVVDGSVVVGEIVVVGFGKVVVVGSNVVVGEGTVVDGSVGVVLVVDGVLPSSQHRIVWELSCPDGCEYPTPGPGS